MSAQKLAVIIASLSFFWACDHRDTHTGPGIEFLRHEAGFSKNKKTLVVILGFSDFSCGLCFQDFLALSRSLSVAGVPEGSFRIYFRQEGRDVQTASQLIEEWADIYNITSPVAVFPDSLAVDQLKSGARIFLFERDRITKADSLPVGSAGINAFLKQLAEE